MPKMGTLYGVGIGPGDPELLTLKAARVIGAVPVIAVPVARPGGRSYALEIVAGMLRPEQEILQLLFPMLKDVDAKASYRRAAAESVLTALRTGREVAFLTEGDPLFHSTFIYLLAELPAGTPLEVVPGISSVNAAAAQTQLPLVNAGQRLAILPVTFEDEAALRETLCAFDTIVLMKFHRDLDRLLDLLDELGLTEYAVIVERASHPDARVIRDVRSVRGESVHYLSLMIVRKGGGRAQPQESG